MESTEIKKSRNGQGVFAKVNFKSGDKIFEIKGEFISGDEDEDIDEKTRDNAIRFDKDKYISPSGTEADFVNHSCEPNSAVVKKDKKLFIVTVRNIKKGEEILIDYSTITASDDIWEMKCNCGSENCRKVVRRFDSLPEKTKDRYLSLNMVPDYISN